MTNREMFEAIINGTITDEVVEKATEELKKLDERNAKRVERNAEKAKENKPLMDKLFSLLTSEPATTATLAEAVGLSTPKASPLLRKMVEDEGEYASVRGTEVKVPKKGKQKAYYVAQ